jgi:hypothetical protein
MKSDPQFDFWYAVNNTEVVAIPENHLETFGNTMVNYHLVSELMDSTDKIRVREGKLTAFRPTIITPQGIPDEMLDGFGAEAQEYADWMRQNASDLRILRYGFKIQKTEINDYVLSDSLETVVNRIQDELKEKKDHLGAVVVGVDHPWEVCLLKLMSELVQNSVAGNIQDIHQLERDQKTQLHRNLEQAFLEASRDAAKVQALADLLKQNGLFERFEDRFFAAVRSSK